ncbi:conserved oligomeric Golgi complex subunit 8 [Biomphalaria glabrata]|nr:conserved oligomeric Golgi complex subunit 8 [Biomphalaria glabrata]
MTLIDGTWTWVSDNSTVNSPRVNAWLGATTHEAGFDCQTVDGDKYGIYLIEKQCSDTSFYVCMGSPVEIIETPTNIEIEDKGKQGAEDKGKQGAEDKGKQGAEDKGKQGAENKGKQGAEDKGKHA